MSISRRERRIQRQAERETQGEAQQDTRGRRRRNRRVINYAIGLLIFVAVAYGIFALLKNNDGPGQYDQLAQCLTSNGATMYGTDWCPHCKAQKELFGSSFRYVTYLNCDTAKAACDAARVQGYPTWTFPKGEPLAGEQPLALLAERAGCQI